MPNTGNAGRRLMAAAGISAALWLTACGGSSGKANTAASGASHAAAQVQSTSATSASVTSQARTSASTRTAARTGTGTSTSTSTKTQRTSTPTPPSSPRHNRALRAGIRVLTRCLELQGVAVPPQNLSSPHPKFNPKGISTTTPQFKACWPKAMAAFHAVEGSGTPRQGSAKG